MWFRSEEQKDAELIFNSKVALTAAMFHSDRSHVLIKLSENWFQQRTGKPAIGSYVVYGQRPLHFRKLQHIYKHGEDFFLYNVSDYFQKWTFNFILFLRIALSCSPSESKHSNPFLLFWVKNILSNHLYPTGWKFPDKQKCIEMSKIILVLLWQQIQLLLISCICSCLFCFLQKLICRKEQK